MKLDLALSGSLDRFLSPQQSDYPIALREIRTGLKSSHWMWYIFPQLALLGRSERARYFGLHDLAVARAYLAHPVLGMRLIEISDVMLSHTGTPPAHILGPVDALKLRSCATLFGAAGAGTLHDVLTRFFDGELCQLTIAALDPT